MLNDTTTPRSLRVGATTRRTFLASAVLTGLSLPQLQACLWDRDTLAAEAVGEDETLKVIVGWFDRNPPEYFQLRLRQVEEEMKSASGKRVLLLCDDAGVACDRLGRPDEAISWMNRKSKAMELLPVTSEDKYRHRANLGTFYAHRWLAKPDRAADTSDLKRGIDLITEAIKINPKAHFGREIRQLEIMRWMLACYQPGAAPKPYRPSRGSDPHDAVIKGMIGLIRLGTAWESIDVFGALAGEILNSPKQQASIAILAAFRARELAQKGKSSVLPGGDAQIRWLHREALSLGQTFTLESPLLKAADSYYKKARAAADDRHAARTTFMTTRLAEGKHPDSDPRFWEGWTEPKFCLPIEQ